MDVKLLGRALQYHGVELLKRLKEEDQEIPSPDVLAYLDRKQPDLEIKDDRFMSAVRSFIARKSDLLYKPFTLEEKVKEEEGANDTYAIMPPLDAFTVIPSHDRRIHFHNSLKANHCVTGVVKTILDSGLLINLLCVDIGPIRCIKDLELVAYCPAKELPRLYAKESALDAFQENDIVRGIILNVDSERIIMSLHERSIPDVKAYPRIGLITEDEFPVHYRRIKEIEDKNYEELLQSIMGFNNLGNVKALLQQEGVYEQHSYLRYMSRLDIPEKEYAQGLKKWQSQKLAHQSVALGVEKFKSGSYHEAMQHFNRALQTDVTNVEALVARGAL